MSPFIPPLFRVLSALSTEFAAALLIAAVASIYEPLLLLANLISGTLFCVAAVTFERALASPFSP